ncbi:MAG: hypothetical protein SNJ74_09525, partial [Fimbriimonadaceae bacterium]
MGVRGAVWAIGAGLLAVGCAGNPERVWVDPAVWQADSLARADSVGEGWEYATDDWEANVAAPREIWPAATVGLPPVSEEVVSTPGQAARIAEARETVIQNRARARRGVESRLLRTYLREVARFRVAEADALAQFDAEARAEGEDEVRAAFSKYARERGPVVARLAMLLGFPYPDPRPIPLPEETIWGARRRLAEAKERYDELGRMDAEYQNRVSAILTAVRAQTAERRAQIELAVAERTDAAASRAQTDAARVFAESGADYEASLAERPDVAFAALPGRTQSLPGGTPAPSAPVLPGGTLAGRQTAGSEIRHDLRIWLGIRGFQLANRPAGVRDPTDE